MMKLHFLRKHTQAGNAVSFLFQPDEPTLWEAGQYITLELPDLPVADNSRTFTISGAPFEEHFTITTRITQSAFKQRLNRLEHNEVIQADQVGGDFVWIDTKLPKVFIAGGIGITPFHSILKQRDHDNAPLSVNLLYANRDTNIVFQTELDAWKQKHPEMGLHYVINETLDMKKIHQLVPYIKDSYVYISGPEPMVDSFEQQLLEFGLSKDQLKQDWFPGYNAKNF